jgi:mannose-6-phosphate isomerase
MLTYTSAPSHAQLLRPEPFDGSDGKTMLYDPPIEEFSVLRLELAGGDKEKHRAVSGPSIVIVTDGEGSVRHGSDVVDVARGEVVFVAAGTEVEWQATKSGLVAFRAFVEVAN